MTSRARARVLILLLTTILLVSLGSSPLWSQDGGGMPRAIGFVSPDGQTGISQFTVEAEDGPEPTYGMALGIPSEPPDHQLVYLTNLERVSRGVRPLKAASELMDAAQFHSDWMADRDCFAHNCPGEPDWVTRIVNAGYSNYQILGENVAAGYPTAGGAVNGWMGSAGHRANMLNPEFREAGGGYAYSASSQYVHYWTLDFGSRGQVYPVIVNNEAWSTTDLVVDLYVHGSGWGSQMQFRNEGGNWSAWEPFSANKSWELAIPFSVQPNLMIFLSEQGTTPTVPAYYSMTVDSCSGDSAATVDAQIRQGSVTLQSSDEIYISDYCEAWTASADQSWILLAPDSGLGLTTVTVSVLALPPGLGPHTATISVETSEKQANVQVTLVVTDDPLTHSDVPLVALDSP